MALEIEGSNPFAHPTGLLDGFIGKGWPVEINLPILLTRHYCLAVRIKVAEMVELGSCLIQIHDFLVLPLRLLTDKFVIDQATGSCLKAGLCSPNYLKIYEL